MIPKFSSVVLLSLLGTALLVAGADNQCFEDREELRYAINVCFEGGIGTRKCHHDTETDVDECERVKETHGLTMNSWCVGNVDDMHFLFVEKRDFNEDISGWNTSSVTSFYEMFSYTSSFNCDLSQWDTSKVREMPGMFNGAGSFNGDISTWDTSSLTDMQWMFYGASIFNGDMNQWDVSKVTNMYEVFAFARSFNQDISGWNASRVTDMSGLFWEALDFNQDISSWDLSSVDNLEYGMFQGAAGFNQTLCAWRDTFPYSIATETFTDSGCIFQDNPNADDRGPFCASDCLIRENATTAVEDEDTAAPMFHGTVDLTSAAAQAALEVGEREAAAHGWSVTIVVADAGGVPLVAKRGDGAFPASYDIAAGKARMAALFHKPTGTLEDAVNATQGGGQNALLLAPFVLMKGGVPIFVNDVCVGAVGVSGVKPEEDEKVALASIDGLPSNTSKL